MSKGTKITLGVIFAPLVALLGVLAVLSLLDLHDPTPAELRQQGYVDCKDWAQNVGTDLDAKCIDDDGTLVKYGDSSYGWTPNDN